MLNSGCVDQEIRGKELSCFLSFTHNLQCKVWILLDWLSTKALLGSWSTKLAGQQLLFPKKPAQKCLIMEIWGIFSDLCTQGPLMRGIVLAQLRLRAGNMKYKMSAARYQLLPWFVCHMCHCPVQHYSDPNNHIFVPRWKRNFLGRAVITVHLSLVKESLLNVCCPCVFFRLGSSKIPANQGIGDSLSFDSL